MPSVYGFKFLVFMCLCYLALLIVLLLILLVVEGFLLGYTYKVGCKKYFNYGFATNKVRTYRTAQFIDGGNY